MFNHPENNKKRTVDKDEQAKKRTVDKDEQAKKRTADKDEQAKQPIGDDDDRLWEPPALSHDWESVQFAVCVRSSEHHSLSVQSSHQSATLAH
jgi:hypothetical protein